MDGWNLLQFKTKIGRKARQKCMVPRVVPKTPKYPLYLKMIAEKSMPRVKPTNAKMSSIPILQYLLGGENTLSPKYSLTWWFCSLWWWCQTCRHTYLQISANHSSHLGTVIYVIVVIKYQSRRHCLSQRHWRQLPQWGIQLSSGGSRCWEGSIDLLICNLDEGWQCDWKQNSIYILILNGWTHQALSPGSL